MKIGRNERCSCGSGKKFKHCCDSRRVQKPPAAAAIPGAKARFDRTMSWIDERLREENVSFPDRPTSAARKMEQLLHGLLHGTHLDSGALRGLVEGGDVAHRISHWYRQKYPVHLLTPGLKLETEEDFQGVMEQLDEEAKSSGTLIQGRPLRALKRLTELTKTELRLTVPDRDPESGEYSGDDLVIRMEQWYDERYGNRLNLPSNLGTVVFLLRGDLWFFQIPVIRGVGPGVVWICEYGAESTLTSTPEIVRRGQRLARKCYNILESVENLPEGLAKSLTEDERKRMLAAFILGIDAHEALDERLPNALIDAARGDLEATVTHLTSHPVHPGQAKWSALQAAEKMLKALITEKHGTFGYHHNLSTLALEVSRLGIPSVDPQLIVLLQTGAGARYGEFAVSIDEAVTAHHASLRIVAHTAPYLPKR
jgi:hypothetical protein